MNSNDRAIVLVNLKEKLFFLLSWGNESDLQCMAEPP